MFKKYPDDYLDVSLVDDNGDVAEVEIGIWFFVDEDFNGNKYVEIDDVTNVEGFSFRGNSYLKDERFPEELIPYIDGIFEELEDKDTFWDELIKYVQDALTEKYKDQSPI